MWSMAENSALITSLRSARGTGLNLLFGNMGYGVYRFNETINGLEPLTTHKYENMNLNKVVPIIKDDADNYLIGTTYGVIKYASENSYQLFNDERRFSEQYYSCHSEAFVR